MIQKREYITRDHVARYREAHHVQWGPIGKDVFSSRYSRTLPDGTKEDWYDTVQRVVNGNMNLINRVLGEKALDKLSKELQREAEELYDLMVRMVIIPGGRHLWATGIADSKQFLHNCHCADFTDSITTHFEYTFMRLMEGGGVGANYSNLFIHSNPNHPKGYWIPANDVELHFICRPDHQDMEMPVNLYGEEVQTLPLKDVLSKEYAWNYDAVNGNYVRVQDSREGWCEALRKVIAASFTGSPVTMIVDISNIRPYGADIKAFGGKASGPAALVQMLANINALLNSIYREKRPLNSLDYMTIDHYIAEAVVAGGTRRSARMSLKYWKDEDIMDFIHCKRDPLRHWSTNISVVIDDRFIKALSRKDQWAMEVYDAVVEGMLRDGEPGLVNATRCLEGEVPGTEFYSTNPCVTADTLIATADGVKSVAELIGTPFAVRYYGRNYVSSGFFHTGKKPVYRVTTREGSWIKVTEDHKLLCYEGHQEVWLDVKTLKRWLDDGRTTRVVIAHTKADSLNVSGLPVHGNRNDILDNLNERLVRHSKGYSMLVSTREEAESWKLALNLLGIRSEIAYNAGAKDWSVRIEAQEWQQVQNERRTAHLRKSGPYNSGGQWYETVESVQQVGEEDVYDTQVPNINRYISNGFVSHNCGEIAFVRYPDLPAFDVCCLGHVNLEAIGSDKELAKKAFRLMTRFLIRATFAPSPDPLQEANIKRNRRIGVGFLGYHAWLAQQGIKYSEAPTREEVRQFFREMYQEVSRASSEYARMLRIPEPIKKTTIAPTGTIANLPGTTSGIQPLFSKYYIRRVRYANSEPKLEEIRKLGKYRIVDDIYAENTSVVEYVCIDPVVERIAKKHDNYNDLLEDQHEIPLRAFLENQAMLQQVWADNAISITINIDPNKYTKEEVKQTLQSYLRYLKGVTMFPILSRPLSPLEPLTKEQLYRYMDEGYPIEVTQQEDECVTGCPVV